MSGIYVLKTKDAYRVAFSKDYDCLYGDFNDDNIRFDINVDYLNRIFGNSSVILTSDDAEQVAKAISKNIEETDDGIMYIRTYEEYTFEELLNGKANKKGKD